MQFYLLPINRHSCPEMLKKSYFEKIRKIDRKALSINPIYGFQIELHCRGFPVLRKFLEQLFYRKPMDGSFWVKPRFNWMFQCILILIFMYFFSWTYFNPMFRFYTPWKRRKNFGIFDVFKGYRHKTLGWNGLTTLTWTHSTLETWKSLTQTEIKNG